MGRALDQISFRKMFRMDHYQRDLTELMVRIRESGVGKASHVLTPAIIHLVVSKTTTDKDAPTMRAFLKGLRAAQHSYFVRFATDLLWIMEADCGVDFYSWDESAHRHKDVTISVKVVSKNHIELKVVIHSTTRTHLTIQEIARSVYPCVGGLDPAKIDMDEPYDVMAAYHHSHKLDQLFKSYGRDFHMVFIPSLRGDLCYPIPLIGMTIEDAKRKALLATREIESLQQTLKYDVQKEIVGKLTSHHAALILLIDKIQTNEERGDRSFTAPTTYALVELLFAHYLVLQQELCGERDYCNEMLWLDLFEEDGQIEAETYALYEKNHPA